MTDQTPLVNMADVDENDVGGSVLVDSGRYKIYIANHEFKTTSAGLGLRVWVEITEGDNTGRRPNDFFNLRHDTSADAVRISTVVLKQITIAAGLDGNQILTEAVINQWYGKPMVCDMQREKSTNPRYPEDNMSFRRFYHPDHVPDDVAPPTGIRGAEIDANAPPAPPTSTAQAAGSTPAPPPASTAAAPTTAPSPAPATAPATAPAPGGTPAAPAAPAPAAAPATAPSAPAAADQAPVAPAPAAPTAPAAPAAPTAVDTPSAPPAPPAS